MKFPLPVGNPEVMTDSDVEILMRTELVPYFDTILGIDFMGTDGTSRHFKDWNFEDGSVELVAKSEILECDGDEFGPPSVEVEKVIEFHIGVRASDEEHEYYKMMELLEYGVDSSYVRLLKSGRLHLHRLFTLYYDPCDEVIRSTIRRAGFLDKQDLCMYDIDCPEDEERDDERVCHDEFDLLKAAILRIRSQ